jgi:8-amino-7-oxononanoate synthase
MKVRTSLAWMEDELQRLREQSALRKLHTHHVTRPGWIMRDGQKMLNLASNDYLGLAQDTDTITRVEGLESGAAASRLITGNHELYTQLEQEFAAFKRAESCLIFGSGYAANVSVLAALAGRDDVVFSDRLNHASIVDGIVLSRAELKRYRHLDLEHLEHLLKRTDKARRKWIVTDAVFSMDGTIAPLPELVRLKERYGAMLMIDEAHSGGLFGEEGRGLAEHFGVEQEIEVRMGTFSKAYGVYGAYIAGDRVLTHYLLNKARGLIYSTALPPIVLQLIRNNWIKVRTEHWRRERVFRHARMFSHTLREAGFRVGSGETPIIPLIVGSNEDAVQFGQELQREGIAAVPVRPPTVPEGTARIRFTLMSVHEEEDLKIALDKIIRTGKKMGLIG